MTRAGIRSSSTVCKKLCRLEIRPDREFVLFRGSADETPDTKVTGNVVLMISEPMQIKNVRVVLEGKRRTAHFQTDEERQYGPPAATPIINRTTFLREKTDAYSGGQLPAGNHEFPFEFTLPGGTPESVEGIPGIYITYGLKAWVDRGVLTKNICAAKHMRVVRTLAEDPSELSDPQEVQGVWPDKIKYSFSTTSKAAIYGTKLVTSIELTPLLEKLRIGKINFRLKESRKIKTLPGPEYSAQTGSWTGMWKEEQTVMKQGMQIPEGSESTDPTTLLPMYKFKATWPLPKSLSDCRQSVDRNEWIRIKHVVYYDVILHNPDGHLSELKAHHTLKLFISPHVPINENNEVSIPAVDGTGLNIDPSADLHTAPPMYGSHHLDMLYDEVEAEASHSPSTMSGSNTPETNLSRYHSNDSAHSLDNSSGLSASPTALDHRLQHLQEIDGTRRSPGFHLRNISITSSPRDSPSPELHRSTTSQGYFDFVPSYHNRTSNGNESPTEGEMQAQHVEYDMDALGRMPSYEMAVRQLVRTPLDKAPPSYITAVGQPSSSSSHRQTAVRASQRSN